MNIYTLVVIELVLISQSRSFDLRRKRANFDNFNVLLNIYKLNPLKQSNVYKTFSNRILLPRPDEQRTALNYNSKESSVPNRTRNLEQIGEFFNYRSTPDRSLYFDDNEPDIIDPGQILDRLQNLNEFDTDVRKDNYLIQKKETFNYPNEGHEQQPNDRNVHLKVYNLNARSQDNKVNYNDAEVVVVK